MFCGFSFIWPVPALQVGVVLQVKRTWRRMVMPSSGGGSTAEQTAYSNPQAPLVTPGRPPPDAVAAVMAVGCHPPFPGATLLF